MKYTVQVCWMMAGTVEVEADSEKQAIKLAYEHDGLPDGDYVADSFCADEANLSDGEGTT